jgi:hypothetical protein
MLEKAPLDLGKMKDWGDMIAYIYVVSAATRC